MPFLRRERTISEILYGEPARESVVITELPSGPREGDIIGFYNGEWISYPIDYLKVTVNGVAIK